MIKGSWEDKISRIIQIFFLLVFCGAMIYLVYYCLCVPQDNFEENIIYLDSWDAIVDGTNIGTYSIPCKLDLDKGEAVTFETLLPNDIQDDYWMVTRNSKDMVLSIDGEKFFEWSRGDAIVPGELARAAFVYIPLKASYSGKKISMLRGNPKLYNGALGQVIVGDKYSIRLELLRTRGGIQFILALFIFILSLILTVIGAFLRNHYKQNVYLVTASFGIMVASAWMLFDSDAFEVITGVRYINGFMSYIMTFIMVFPFIFYIDGLQEYRYRRTYCVLSVAEVINFLTFLILHLTGVFTFSDALLFMDAIIAVIAVVVMLCIIYDMAKGRAMNYLYVAVGFLAFIVLCIVEIAFVNSGTDRIEGGFILTGLFVLMIVSVVQQIEDIKKEQGFKQIEYESNAARTEFLSNMSHEIRTPINTILGMNEMIMHDNVIPEIKEYSERIQHSGQVLLSLINDILDYSRYQMEDEEFVKKDYNVRRMLDVLVAVLRDGAQLKNLEVNVIIPADIPKYLKGDEQHISRVLSNLISNSIKYTNKGSISFTVLYDTKDNGNFLDFYIKDTGVGIKPEHLKTIFEPFSRADIRKNRSVAGTGLGLAITKELVEKMGGTIEVMSIFGEGSSFRVRIPQEVSFYVGEENEQSEQSDAISEGELTSQEAEDPSYGVDEQDNTTVYDELDGISPNYKAPKAKILAVDDNYSNVIVISEFLKSIEVQLDIASGGAEAIQMANMKKYDIILMDHMMPEPDGVEAMHTIRESLESLNRKTPDIVLTANAIGNCKELYINEGFDNYLSKPIERELLLRMIRKYLNPKLVVDNDSADLTELNEGNKTNLTERMSELENNGIINFPGLFTRFENQDSVVNMVLKETVREGDKKINLLRQCFEEGDIGRYAVEAHGVKGVMASICADKFSAHAREHEFAAKAANIDFIEADIDSFLSEYRSVLDYITKYLTDAGVEMNRPRIKSSEAVVTEEIENIIYEIEESLNDFDADRALSYVEKLAEAASPEQMNLVDKIREYTDDFEYDKALECCAELRK